MLTSEMLKADPELTGKDQTKEKSSELHYKFTQLRETDDEFARDYRRGEFVDWLNNEGYQLLSST